MINSIMLGTTNVMIRYVVVNLINRIMSSHQRGGDCIVYGADHIGVNVMLSCGRDISGTSGGTRIKFTWLLWHAEDMIRFLILT